MSKIVWDAIGERFYETGVDHGVLYLQSNGDYPKGVAWNGLVSVAEKPTGAEQNAQYADNIKYLNLTSAEEFGATIEAFTYPEEFGRCDGTAIVSGVQLAQQRRETFGLSYRTKVGNDTLGTDFAYKLHLVYGAQASVSERSYSTINDSPEAITFSWELTTTSVPVSNFKPTSLLTIQSNKVDATKLKSLEDILYGTDGTNPRLPLPDEVIALFAGSGAVVTPAQPTYDAASHTITVPTATGVKYIRTDTGKDVTGSIVLKTGESVVLEARPVNGSVFPNTVDTDWQYKF